jgi:hypothetical protein
MVVNYIVHIQDWNSSRSIECSTKEDAWKALNSMAFGGLYQVVSPTGKDVTEFIPF